MHNVGITETFKKGATPPKLLHIQYLVMSVQNQSSVALGMPQEWGPNLEFLPCLSVHNCQYSEFKKEASYPSHYEVR